MRNSRFMQLFASLHREEAKKLEKYLNSPYFHVKTQARQLMSLLVKTFDQWQLLWPEVQNREKPDPKSEKDLETLLSKEIIFKKLFPDEPYNDSKMRRIIFESKKVLSDFLFQLALSEAPNLPMIRQNNLLRHHLQRGEFDLFETQLKEAQHLREDTRFRDAAFFNYAYQIENCHNDYQIRTRGREDSFQQMGEFMDTAYILSKLRLFCAMRTREKEYKFGYEYPMEEAISSFAEERDHEHAPLLRIYSQILKLEKGTASAKDFVLLRDLTELHQPHIPKDEMRQIYGFMLNYLLRESRKPNTNHHPETFGLLKKMYREGLIYKDGMITPYYFELVVLMAAKSKDFDFAEDFIYDHEEKLAGKEAAEIFDFCLLLLLFYKGEYAAILKRVDSLKFKVARSRIRLRMLKLKSLYEMGDSEGFFLLSDSLRKFIRSKEEIGETALTYYSNFVSWAEKIGRLRFNQRKANGEVLEELEKTPAAEKDWLREKCLALL